MHSQQTYGATRPGEHEVALSSPVPHEANAGAPAKSWGKTAGFVAIAVSCGLAGLALAARTGAAAVSRGADLRVYLDDDLFAGTEKTWSDEKKIIRKMDNGTQLSCADWDDDRVYPTGKCDSGDAKQCESLTEYSAFNSLCAEACNVTNSTWGVPCTWEVISNLEAACDTVYGGDLTFNWTFPDSSKNQAPNYYKEYQYNTKTGKAYVPYAFNASIDGSNWDDCNSHAFCYSCVDDEGAVNGYCHSVISLYSTIYDASAFFKNFEYWCSVKDDIKLGTYAVESTCAGGARLGCEGYNE